MPRKKQSFRRRPNKSGTVVKLSGTRSKPFMAKITTGYDNITGHQIQKPIGYFETRQEALDALTLYNLSEQKRIDEATLMKLGGSTYDTIMQVKNKELPTFEELFELIYEKDIQQLTKTRCGAYKAAFKRLKLIHDKKINTISLFDMQACIDVSKKKVGSKVLNDMKTICVKVFEYAVIHQYISRDSDFTSYIDASKKETKVQKHKSFTLDEIKLLLNSNTQESKMVLIFIFTGARPIELLNINTKKIFIDENNISYMITGSKTEAGKNRVIPIHDLIKPFIIELLNKHSQYLLIPQCNNITHKFKTYYFDKAMNEINANNHTPYDCRHTFASLAKLYKVDDYCRKKIMGHKSNDLTDDVYTHAFKEELFKEINKIDIK